MRLVICCMFLIAGFEIDEESYRLDLPLQEGLFDACIMEMDFLV